MVRKLKFHEQKLLKKVDFINWKVDNSQHENKIIRRFHIRKKEDYTTYNKLSREVRNVVEQIATLEESNPEKKEMADILLDKLYNLGAIDNKSDLETASRVTASSFCKRRLPCIMIKHKLAQHLKNATDLIEQGHVRVGPDMIKDPAFLVTRNMEDFVTWVDSSAIRKHVMEYNELRDDFDL